MRINTFILHKDYTRFPQNYQLVLPLDIEHLIPDDDSVRLLSQFIERMFLGDLYRTYCREGHANEPTPRQLLKILQRHPIIPPLPGFVPCISVPAQSRSWQKCPSSCINWENCPEKPFS